MAVIHPLLRDCRSTKHRYHSRGYGPSIWIMVFASVGENIESMDQHMFESMCMSVRPSRSFTMRLACSFAASLPSFERRKKGQIRLLSPRRNRVSPSSLLCASHNPIRRLDTSRSLDFLAGSRGRSQSSLGTFWSEASRRDMILSRRHIGRRVFIPLLE